MTAASVLPPARRRLRAGPALGVLLPLLLWELLAQATAGSFILAGPSEIVGHIWANFGLMSRALGITLHAAALGFLYGNLAAVVLAVICVLLPRAERMVSALALLCFCLPLVATGPILRVLYGTGTGPQVTLAALSVYYTTFLPLMVGLRAAPASWFDLVRTYGRGRLTELWRVRARAALPYFIAGLQIAAPAAFLGALVGEFTGAERGMGVLVIRAMRSLDVPATWALATVASAVAMVAYAALGWAGRKLTVAPPALLLAPPRSGGGTGRLRGAGGALLLGAVVTALVLALWWGVMEGFGLNRFFAKRPGEVWQFLFSGPDAAANRAVLFGAFGQTLGFTLPGYFAGLALGAGLAAAIVVSPGLSASVLPVAVALRSVPIVTTAPLIVLALGRGAAGTVTIVAVMIFFPTLVACLQGLRQTPGQVMDVFDSYAAGRWQRLVFAQVPAMLPAFFASARMAVPAAFLAATTAEWLATGTGMGSLMALTASTSAYNMLWSAIVLLSVTASLAYVAVGWVERAVLSVYASEQLAR
jgi:sulfonate transport system permease protein